MNRHHATERRWLLYFAAADAACIAVLAVVWRLAGPTAVVVPLAVTALAVGWVGKWMHRYPDRRDS